jgi:hypothetical protein
MQIMSRQLTTTGGYGPREFWRVSLRDGTTWDYAKPFSASSSCIILNECLECYQCGVPSTLVRRAGSVVIWLRTHRDDVPVDLQYGEAKVFDAAEYEQLLGGNVADLPCISWIEARHELRSQLLPSANLALYTIPDTYDDGLSGATWLGAVRNAIEGIDETLSVAAAPEHYSEIRIGLDAPGIPEVVVDRVQFVSFPRFPCWISSGSIQRSFGDKLG